MTTGSRMQLTSLRTSKRDDEVLELSYEETRRSPVQIRAAPPQFLSWFFGLKAVDGSLPPSPLGFFPRSDRC